MEIPPRSYETYERPGLVVAYVVGPCAIGKGWQVGLDEEGLLAPISKAVCFVGVANEAHSGCAEVRHDAVVNVTTVGSFVFAFLGWTPTLHDLQRAVWSCGETEVAGAPLRSPIPVGRVVGVSATSDGRPGVRVQIDRATDRCLPPLPGKVLD